MEVRSTIKDIEEFTKSFIWKDIVDELRNLQLRSQLEYDLVGEPKIEDNGTKVFPSTAETLIHLGEVKGRRKAVEYFLSIPDILIGLVEEQKNDSRLDSTD